MNWKFKLIRHVTSPKTNPNNQILRTRKMARTKQNKRNNSVEKKAHYSSCGDDSVEDVFHAQVTSCCETKDKQAIRRLITTAKVLYNLDTHVRSAFVNGDVELAHFIISLEKRASEKQRLKNLQRFSRVLNEPCVELKRAKDNKRKQPDTRMHTPEAKRFKSGRFVSQIRKYLRQFKRQPIEAFN